MNTFLRKLGSRKLWMAIAGVVVGLASAFGVDESEYAPIVGVIGSIASCIAYILGESKIDAASANGKDYYMEVSSEDVSNTGVPQIGTQDPDKGEDE